MDMMQLSVWLYLALNGVEDTEDWRSALSVQKSLRWIELVMLKLKLYARPPLTCKNGSNQQNTCKHDMQCIIGPIVGPYR